LLFSEQKFRVTGFDIDQRKVDTLAKVESYIYRIGGAGNQTAKAQGFLPLRLRAAGRDGRHHHLRSHPSRSIP